MDVSRMVAITGCKQFKVPCKISNIVCGSEEVEVVELGPTQKETRPNTEIFCIQFEGKKEREREKVNNLKSK